MRTLYCWSIENHKQINNETISTVEESQQQQQQEQKIQNMKRWRTRKKKRDFKKIGYNRFVDFFMFKFLLLYLRNLYNVNCHNSSSLKYDKIRWFSMKVSTYRIFHVRSISHSFYLSRSYFLFLTFFLLSSASSVALFRFSDSTIKNIES